MNNKDPRIDAYIAKSAAFSRPILAHIRRLVHQACPEVEETLKWSMPAFVHKGLLCVMAAFKAHVALTFWKHELVVGKVPQKSAMGQFGRITSLQDLPPDDLLLGYIRKAAELNEAGVKSPTRTKTNANGKRKIAVPDFMRAALKKNPQAQANFDKFSYSHKKEYVDWVTQAKREETRQKRLQNALVWIAQGKTQNWEYMGC